MFLVVGGQNGYVGKTNVVTSLIQALPEVPWHAVKVTPTSETVAKGSIWRREPMANSRTEAGRYLAAGANQAYSLALCGSDVGNSLPELEKLRQMGTQIICESTCLPQQIKADLFLFVVNPAEPAWSESAKSALPYVDAFVLIDHADDENIADWHGSKPIFRVSPSAYCSLELQQFVAEQMLAKSGTVQ